MQQNEIMEHMVKKYKSRKWHADWGGASSAYGYREACYDLADILKVDWRLVEARLKGNDAETTNVSNPKPHVKHS